MKLIEALAYREGKPSADGKSEEKHDDGRSQENDDEAEISSKYAKVILVGGVCGGAAALASGPILAAFGFTATGVTAGSFAAGWQSTMPFVSSGSSFAYLQSVAMGSSGGFTSGAILGGGGAAEATKVKEICQAPEKQLIR